MAGHLGVRDTIRRKHYLIRTEHAYVNWIRHYILFHNKRHPKDLGCIVSEPVRQFLGIIILQLGVLLVVQRENLA